MLKDFGPKISELEGVTEVIGSNSIVREVRTVDFVFLAVEEPLKFFEQRRGQVQTSASEGEIWQQLQLGLELRESAAGKRGRTA